MAEVTLTLPEALKQAAAAYQQGRFDEADKICRAILGVKTDDFSALHLLAVVQTHRGLHDEAQASFAKALAIRPDHAELHFNHGVSLQFQRRFDDALASYDRALTLQPQEVKALNYRGNVLRELNRLEEALASYDRALEMRPDYAEALNNRGVALNDLKRFEEALASYDRALTVQPEYPEALNNRGIALTSLNRNDEAMECVARAIALRPTYADGFNTRGLAQYQLSQFDEALASYQTAIELKPDFGQAHFNAAHCRLLRGDFEQGWEENEWRWKTAQARHVKRNYTQPQWSGREDIAGKTILLHSEQGFGDTIQFSRYARLVAARGARVILEVQQPLKRLLSGVTGAHFVIARGEPSPPFDLHCPLLSLPRVFGTRLATIPSLGPPLRVPRQVVQSWETKLGPRRKPRIGITWSGRSAHTNDRNRSIALQTLLGFCALPADLVSLQKEVSGDDESFLHSESSSVVHFGDALTDFQETAALVSLMDLVVTVDTSIAHLAASLGRPTWILLPSPPDWRWMLDREDTPWYPSARLFRQQDIGAWGVVIARAAAALSEFMSDLGEADAAVLPSQAAIAR